MLSIDEINSLEAENNRMSKQLKRIKKYIKDCQTTNIYDGFCVIDSLLEILQDSNIVERVD